MIRATALWLLTLGALALPAPRATAAPSPLDEVLTRIDRAKAEVTTLAGEFSQRNRAALFRQELSSKGRFYFKRPRQIRWEYLSPDPSLLVLDGTKAVLSTPGSAPQRFDLEKDATMRAIFDQLLTWLGPDPLRAAQRDYTMDAAGSATAPVLTLTPKPESLVGRAFSRIALTFDPKTWLLRELLLIEQNGDEKRITLSNVVKNGPLPADAFSTK